MFGKLKKVVLFLRLSILLLLSISGIIVLLNSQSFVLLKKKKSDVTSGRQKSYAERHLPHSFPYQV